VLFVAAGVVVLCSLAARVSVVNPVEVAIFEQLGRILGASVGVWRVLALAGGWPGLAAIAALMLYLKRIRLGVQCAAAGLFGWALVQVLDGLVGRRVVPGELLSGSGVRQPGPAGFAFPASHAAVAAAMVAVAAPYFKLGYRAPAWALVVLVAAADTYLGNSLPLGAFAAVFLGWGVGAGLPPRLGRTRSQDAGNGGMAGTRSGRADAHGSGAHPEAPVGAADPTIFRALITATPRKTPADSIAGSPRLT
jgi:hypothetical protein